MGRVLHPYSFYVGNDVRVRFWHDHWFGSQLLKEIFPLLFECSRDRNALIDALYIRSNGRGAREWSIRFVRDFNDWEVDEVALFMSPSLINSVVVVSFQQNGDWSSIPLFSAPLHTFTFCHFFPAKFFGFGWLLIAWCFRYAYYSG